MISPTLLHRETPFQQTSFSCIFNLLVYIAELLHVIRHEVTSSYCFFFSPILYSTKHVADSVPQIDESSDWVVQPMRWGLIPSWHRGEASSIEYKMNNARSDGLLSKASFKKPLECGRRCVVLADG